MDVLAAIKNHFNKYGNYRVERDFKDYLIYNKSIDAEIIEKFRLIFDKRLFYLEINIKDFRKNLSFFKEIPLKNPEDNVFILLESNLQSLEDIINKYLKTYFQYRDLFLDIVRISIDQKNRNRNIITRNYVEPIFDPIISAEINIKNFPLIEEKLVEDYLQRIKKLIHQYDFDSEDDYKELFHFLSLEPIPVEFKIESIYGKISMSLDMFNVPMLFLEDLLNTETKNNICISFFISYLYHYNLQNQFLVSLQKILLDKIMIQ